MANMNGGPQFPNYLSSNQQDLLMAALQSNQLPSSDLNTIDPYSTSLDPAMLSTAQADGLFDELEFQSFNDPQLFDMPHYDPELAQLETSIEAVSASVKQDSAEDDHARDKRKSMAEASPDEEEEGDPKRREGDDKQSKKPGRKPLTNEPTTKRKAQNRAAQRAFRERKEKHLHDLEVKVAELEQSSESTSHENGLLRAQVNSLQSELREYRKRLSSQANISTSPQATAFQSFTSDLSPNQFAFDFATTNPYVPYGPVFPLNPMQQSPKSTLIQHPSTDGYMSRHGSAGAISPYTNSMNTPGSTDGGRSQHGSVSQSVMNEALGSPASEVTNQKVRSGSADTNSSYNIFAGRQPEQSKAAGTSNDTSNVPTRIFQFNSGSSASPSASSGSQYGGQGPSSSCGTSPESTTGVNKEAKTTESQATSQPNAGITSGFEALASAPNAFSVFGGGQDILSAAWPTFPDSNIALQGDGSFSGAYTSDSPSIFDTQSPMNWNDLTGSMRTGLTPATQKPNPFDGPEILPSVREEEPQLDDAKFINCNKVWEAIKQRPDLNEIDMDNLCTELRKKARCSESGVLIDKHHVDKALERLPGA